MILKTIIRPRNFAGAHECTPCSATVNRPWSAGLARRFLLPVLILLGAALADFRPLHGEENDLRIGIIDFFGLRAIPADRVRGILGVKEGDLVPEDHEEAAERIKERIRAIPGVADASLDLVCCHEGAAILFVGIEEEGAPQLNFRSAPRSTVALSALIVEDYERFGEALARAVKAGNTGDDLSQGHSLSSDPECRALQEKFIGYATSDGRSLRRVMKRSADPEQRAIATWMLGYTAEKSAIVGDLHHAMGDPDSNVRNNAMRALGAIAVYAGRHPDAGIRIRPAWFIDMLNSIAWSDRNKALFVLHELTRGRDPGVLWALRERALPSLVEAARWRSPGHAYPAFLLLGRLAGLPEERIVQLWTEGEKEVVIEAALRRRGRSR